MPALSIKKKIKLKIYLQYFGCICIPQWQIDENDWHATNHQEFKGEEHKGPQYPFLSLHQDTDYNQVRTAQVFKIEFINKNKFQEKFFKN